LILKIIKDANQILSNEPPYAQKTYACEVYTKTWSKNKKEDPSKGLYFVHFIAEILNEIKLS
jgi:hypothetical protein